ncbi:ADP-ribosyl cyclase/cyclic ADP-ribose hydrolase-like [Ptychodera flava]|uniref:ADP-ribosyl cyclase/cyclic ADP-ribose hydrolase-like n=1 Tax=Ptychodera flava TaxID=63121 RepID=UPI003969BCBC
MEFHHNVNDPIHETSISTSEYLIVFAFRHYFYSGDGPYDESHNVKIPYVTLEHTLTGNVLDRIGAWCGKLEYPGINYDECPDRNACHYPDPESNAKCAFWQQASITFAKLAAGDVQVLLDGAPKNGEKAFHPESYFNLYELPNLDKDKVKTIHILVMYSTKNIIETCSTGSIKELQNKISRTFKYGYTCKNFTGFDAVDEHSGRRAIDDTANCYFPCTASSVGLNFVMLLICTLCALVEINKQ